MEALELEDLRKLRGGVGRLDGQPGLSVQTRRVVVNLDDCPVSIQEIQKELLAKPIDALEEVITICAGEIEHIYP